VIPFTYQTVDFEKELAKVKASSDVKPGFERDTPEDVFSALELAAHQDWRSLARAIIHIAGDREGRVNICREQVEYW
jgi:hypothetical protein